VEKTRYFRSISSKITPFFARFSGFSPLYNREVALLREGREAQ